LREVSTFLEVSEEEGAHAEVRSTVRLQNRRGGSMDEFEDYEGGLQANLQPETITQHDANPAKPNIVKQEKKLREVQEQRDTFQEEYLRSRETDVQKREDSETEKEQAKKNKEENDRKKKQEREEAERVKKQNEAKSKSEREAAAQKASDEKEKSRKKLIEEKEEQQQQEKMEVKMLKTPSTTMYVEFSNVKFSNQYYKQKGG
jgi:hypothetical protein